MALRDASLSFDFFGDGSLGERSLRCIGNRILRARAKIGKFCNVFTAVSPTICAQTVARNAVPTIAVGFFAPFTASKPTAVAGIN